MTERSIQHANPSLSLLARPGGIALIPLFAFVALIPVEEAVSLGGLGTLSRGVGVVFALLYAAPRFDRLTLRAMPLAGWAYLEWAVLSTVWSINANVALSQLATLVQLFAIAVLIADVVVHDPGLVRPLLWTYSLAAGFTAALGVLAYLAGNRFDNARAVALAGQDPAHFAGILLPAFIFCTFELLHRRRLYLSIPIAMLSLAAILLSGTRGAWVSIVVVFALFVLPALEARRRIGAFVLIVVLSVVALQIPQVGDLVGDRVATAASSGGAGRTVIWAVGLKIFETSPVIGVGFANFPVAYTPQIMMEAGGGLAYGQNRAPHNLVLSTSAELGLVGLVLLGLLLVPLVVRRGWGPDQQAVRAILAAFVVDAMFLDLFANRKHVWLIVGIAAGLAYLARRAESVDEPPATEGGAVPAVTRPSASARRTRRSAARQGSPVSMAHGDP